MNNPFPEIQIYTDGSCHTQLLLGTWVALILRQGEKVVLSGVGENTSHNRMELTAVIEALRYLADQKWTNQKVTLYSDSQYVVGLPGRFNKLSSSQFISKAGNSTQNADLVKSFMNCLQEQQVDLVKVKAHQKNGDLLNKEADELVRKLMREEVRKIAVRET